LPWCVELILEACTIFFILSFFVLNFKLFFSMHFTTQWADSTSPPTSSLNTEISLALHENVWMKLYAVIGVEDREEEK
jgi:F0F1-type ATP synthase membrane subunit a